MTTGRIVHDDILVHRSTTVCLPNQFQFNLPEWRRMTQATLKGIIFDSMFVTSVSLVTKFLMSIVSAGFDSLSFCWLFPFFPFLLNFFSVFFFLLFYFFPCFKLKIKSARNKVVLCSENDRCFRTKTQDSFLESQALISSRWLSVGLLYYRCYPSVSCRPAINQSEIHISRNVYKCHYKRRSLCLGCRLLS